MSVPQKWDQMEKSLDKTISRIVWENIREVIPYPKSNRLTKIAQGLTG